MRFIWFTIILVVSLVSAQDTEIRNLISKMDETDKCGQMTQVFYLMKISLIEYYIHLPNR